MSAQSLVDRTLELLRIPSVTGSEERLAEHVQGIVQGLEAWQIRRHGAAVVASFGRGSPHVVLAGHLDTVPDQGNPVPAALEDSIVGLGSSDMKSGLAVMLALAERRKASSRGRLTLIFYDGEEGPLSGNGLSRILDRESELLEADLALLLEPTANAIELGCQGTMHVRVTLVGIAAHSARPWMGRNAIHLALPLITRIAGLPVRKVQMGDAVYREVMSITLAEGGRSRNVIPDRFSINLNFRFAPDRSLEDAEAYLRTFLPSAAEIEIMDAAPAAPPRLDADLVGRFLTVVRAPVRGKQGWTDVAQFAARGVPALNFGPGLPDLAHRRDERVPVENLAHCCDAIETFLEDAGLGS